MFVRKKKENEDIIISNYRFIILVKVDLESIVLFNLKRIIWINQLSLSTSTSFGLIN